VGWSASALASRQVPFQGGLERRHGLFVKAEYEFLVVGAPRISSKKYGQVCIRHGLEAERGSRIFADPLAECGSVFGAEMSVEAEAHLKFIDGFGGDARSEDLVQAFERVMVTL